MGTVRNVQGMSRCEVCGNAGSQCFEVRLGGESHVFDSFECAMRALTPRCGHCGCQLVGHGIVLGNTIYCSYQCANEDSSSDREARIIYREQANL